MKKDDKMGVLVAGIPPLPDKKEMGEDSDEDYKEETSKDHFMRMVKAIRAGKDEEAWSAYQDCTGMDEE